MSYQEGGKFHYFVPVIEPVGPEYAAVVVILGFQHTWVNLANGSIQLLPGSAPLILRPGILKDWKCTANELEFTVKSVNHQLAMASGWRLLGKT